MDSREKARIVKRFNNTLDRLAKAEKLVAEIKEEVHKSEKELYDANIEIGSAYRNYYARINPNNG